MTQRSFLFFSTWVFGMIGTLHLLRVIYGWEASIAGWSVPMWLSVGVGAFALAFSFAGCKFHKK